MRLSLCAHQAEQGRQRESSKERRGDERETHRVERETLRFSFYATQCICE